MENKTQAWTDVKVLDAAEGIVEAFVNSMGEIHSDGDVIDPDAFENSISMNLPITVLSGHDASKIIGKVLDARSVQTGDGSARLYNRIQFNLETQIGREAFSNVSGGYVDQWSVGFNIPEGGSEIIQSGNTAIRLIKDVDWVEVSSVIRGASPNTTTISAKDDKVAIPYRATATTDAAWNGPRTVAAIPNDASRATLRQMFAYVDAEENQTAKSSYKFPHHQWDGGVGDANIRACRAGIAILNGARGGTDIPESDRAGVYRHLRRHLEAADIEAPDLLNGDGAEEEMMRRRRRRNYSDDAALTKEVIDHADTVAATDEQPIAAEAWAPVTAEQRQQVQAKLAELEARRLGIRLQNTSD